MAVTPAMSGGDTEGTPVGAIDVPNPTTSLVGMLSADPEGASAATSAAGPEAPKTSARRRKSVEPEPVQGAGGEATGEPEAAEPETAPEPEEPKADADGAKDAEALLESYKKGNERLKKRNSKLLDDVRQYEAKANLLDGYNRNINDAATAPAFLDHVLTTVAEGLYEGDVTKLLSEMGYTARKSEPADALAGVKDNLFQAIAAEVPKLGFQDDDNDAFIAFGQKIAEMTLGAVAPLLKSAQPTAAPAQAAAPTGDAGFGREVNAAVRAIQEEAPLFTVTVEEAKAAKDAYKRYDLEDALRLMYGERLAEEKQKQEAVVVARRPMTPANGKVHGDSPLAADAVAERAKSGTAISLGAALAAFGDLPGN